MTPHEKLWMAASRVCDALNQLDIDDDIRVGGNEDGDCELSSYDGGCVLVTTDGSGRYIAVDATRHKLTLPEIEAQIERLSGASDLSRGRP